MKHYYTSAKAALAFFAFAIFSLVTLSAVGQRISTDLVSEYHFTEGSGSTVYDISGIAPAADLHIADMNAVNWVPGGGLSINLSTILKTNGAATKHYNALTNSPELSLEMWVGQSNLNQNGPARLMTYSLNTAERNYTLGQVGNEYVIRNRTTDGDNQGMPEQACSQAIQTGLQHVVYSYNVNTGQEKWFINGVLVDTDTRTGALTNWNNAYEFALANEITMDRPWLGTIYLAAIYCQVLDSNEVLHNYNEGLPGDYCETIVNGSSPYTADDNCFITVIENDPYCCNTWWDNICQDAYTDCATTGNPVETCSLDGYNAVNGRVFWLPDFATDLRAAASGLSFTKYDDGTALISGTVESIANPSNGFTVNVWYNNESSYTEWIAAGGDIKNANLGDETAWIFYTLDESKTSSLLGFGAWGGEALHVQSQDDNEYGLQIGDGANALNTNDNGMSMWFDYTGTSTGHGDINATVNCDDDVVPSVNEFVLTCADGLKVSVQGMGMEGQSCASLSTGNEAGDLEFIILETVWKGSNPPATVTFTADGVSYTASAQSVVEGNGSDQGNKRAYRAEVPASSTVEVCVPSGSSNNLRSFVAYEFSSNAGATSTGGGEFVGRHLYNSSYTMTLPIEAADAPRDVVITLPLSDMSDDGRNADFQITAGALSKHYTITGNTNGLSLNLTPFILEGVAGDVTSITIDLISDPGNNPSSFLAAGLAIADAQCETPNEDDVCEVIGYNGEGQRHFWFQNDFGQDWISDADGLQFFQYDDGTAKISGDIYRISNPNEQFEVVIYFNNMSDYAAWTGMGMEAKLCGDATLADAQDWTYWTFDEARPSVLTGRGDLTGEYLFVTPSVGGEEFGLQLGSNGANCKNDDYGFSMWFSYTGSHTGNGDINATTICTTPQCDVDCPADLTVDCESDFSPASTGYPTLVCDNDAACLRDAGEFDFEFQEWGDATEGWSFGPGWQIGTGCDPSCGSIPNVFIDYTSFHTAFNTKLKSPMYTACCTDNVYLSFCMQQDLYGGEDVPGYMSVEYRLNGGDWQELANYQNVFGSTVNYNDTYEVPGAAGQEFEVRFRANGAGSAQYTMGGWGIDDVRVYGQSSGCAGPVEVDVTWDYSDEVSGTCPQVITRTFTAEYDGEAISCEQTITLVDDEAPIFNSTPADATFTCAEAIGASSATAIDNCDDNVSVTQSDEVLGGDCSYVIERTFVATDACGNTAEYVQMINIIEDEPTVSVTTTDDNCTQGEGSITFEFEDSACRTGINLSIDGGATFTNVADNLGSYTFEGLMAGDYDLQVKWGNGECFNDIADVTIIDNNEIELEIKNLGTCIVDLYEWLPGGDQFVEELAPGESIIVTTHVGAMWRIVADNWDPASFDAQYTVEGCFDQVWNVAPDYCNPECDLDVHIDADPSLTVCEGEEITLTAVASNETQCDEIIACYTMNDATTEPGCVGTQGTGIVWQRATGCSGSHTIWASGGDMKLTEYADNTARITGTITNNGQVGIVDVALYDKANDGNTWNASCYLQGISGPESYYTSFLGTITVDGVEYTVEEKVSEMHFILAQGAGLDSGNFGVGGWSAGTFGGCSEWFANLTPCEIPSLETTFAWSTGETTETITVTEAGTYSVTITDCAGCVAMDEVTVTINELPEVTVSSTNPVCLEANGTITFTFADNASRSNIEFSIDGGITYPFNYADNIGSATIDGLAAGTYDLYVRWGNDECPVDLGPITLVADECASLGNYVWFDNDRDGVQDADEEGVEGVTVELYICGEADPIASTETDENGFYIFENLQPGDYYVVFDGNSLPADYVFSPQNAGGDDALDSDADENGATACVELESGEYDDTVDAGINQPVASLGNYVWFDNDRDGIQDADEDGVEGVTVELYICGEADPIASTETDENGFYIFENLEPGVEYFVVFDGDSLPADYVFSPQNAGGDDALDSDADENGATACVELAPGEFNDTIDAGINQPVASLGNYVWFDNDRDGIQDADEDGVEGVTVELYICGEADPIASTETDENGFYIFENLEPGVEYFVVFDGDSLPADYVFSPQNAGGDDALDSDADENGAAACVELAPGEFNDTIDAGINQPVASLGNYVWFDNDRDGIQDADEEGVEGVTVELYICGEADPIASTETDENGFYIFENLEPGVEYFVVFDGNTLPEDFVFSQQDAGGDDALDSDADENGATACVELAPGEYNDTIDAGINNPTGSIGNYVWEDEDQDGVQDADEDGVEGVTVELYICGEADPIASTETDENGFYIFTDLEPGVEYFVVFSDLPVDYTFTDANQGGDDTLDSDAGEDGATACYELGVDEDYEDFDAGIFIPTNVGDYVWYDNNTDGIQDADEDGVEGVVVTLVSAGNDGIFGTADDVVVDTETTDENGFYLFEDVTPGDYIIVFDPETLPTDFVLTAQNEGGDDELDSDADPLTGATAPFTVVYGQDDDLSYDAGITPCPVPMLNGDAPMDVTINCDETIPAAPSVTFSDIIYGEAVVEFSEVMNDLDCGDEIVRTWTATNECENTATVEQVITIIDNEGPVVTAQTPDQTIECDEEVPEINVTFLDNCDNDLTVVVDNWINELDCGYEYVKWCQATDDCGNSAEATVTITVLDTTAPTVVSAPEDVTLECDQPEPTDMPVFEDNCDESLDMSAISSITQLDCGYQVQRTWTATDDCGNETSVSQTITFVDTTAPFFDALPTDYVVNCDNGSSDPEFAGMPEAGDNCDEDVTVTFTDGEAGDECPASFERTWVATDDCGNTTEYVQMITINDFAAPVLTTPADVTIECDESTDPSNTGEATAEDDCSVPMISYVDGPMTGDCPYTIERTWTAEDPCGNEVSGVQTITIVDSVAPVASAEGVEMEINCDEDVPESEITFTDNCDTNIEVTVTTSVEPFGCLYKFYQTLTATDDCGNETSVTNIYTVVDEVAPVLIGVPADETIDCEAPVPSAIVVATDNCDNDVPVALTAETVYHDCGYDIVRTWTATDDCGNTVSASQTLSVEDITAPVITCPADYVVNCDNGSSDPEFAGEPSVEDNCSEFEVTYVDGPATDECPAVFVRTWTATDACGNASSCTQNITINDFAAPAITCPADVTVECTETLDPSNTGEATATDDCSTPNVTYVDGPMTGDCPYTVERTWTAVDPCGNETSCVQTITIEDTVAPVLSGEDAETTIECDATIDLLEPTATDNCDEDVSIELSSVTIPGDCANEWTEVYTWTAMDECGNTDVRTFTVNYEDTTAPVLIGVPADETIDCEAPVPSAIVVATDNCDNDVPVALTAETVYHDCGYDIVRTWTATDDCGNTTSLSQTLSVEDITAPVITCPADYIVNCDNGSSDPEFAGEPTVEDNCSEFEVTYVDGPATDECPAVFVRTWTATDACGNASSCTQNITINDFAAPVITCPADVTVECTESLDPSNTGEATATDDCSTPNVTYVDGPMTGDCPYTVERTWTAVDPCGNETSCVQTITIEDTVAPVLSGEDAETTIECDATIDLLEPTATDNCDEDVSIELSSVTIPGDCANEWTEVYTWTAMDECGNTDVRTFTVNYEDTTAPVLIGVPADETIDCEAPVPSAIVVATDNCDNDVPVALTAETVYHDCGYDIVRTWTATDDCGNTTSLSQTLSVEDIVAPVITCPADYVVNCDNGSSDPEFAGEPTVEDNCSEFEVTYVDGPATDECPAVFVRTWTATDACGNASSCTQNITINDFAAPAITCPADVTVECTETLDPSNTGEATATDDCSTPNVTYVDGPMTGDCPYTVERTWTAVDPCGNETSCVQTITIVDTVAPVLSGEDSTITIECNASPQIVPPTATDNCDDQVSISMNTETIPGDCANEWTEVYTWTATDECGNTDVRTFTVNYEDTTAPVLIGVPADDTIDCEAPVPSAIVVATDNCDNDVPVALTAETNYFDCGYEIVRTWTATDDCGNTTSMSQTLTVEDIVAPVITCPADYTVNCDNGSSDPEFSGEPTVEDNCSEFEVTYVDGPATDGCPAVFVRTWTATDACGNASSCTQNITINDFAAPAITCPADVTVECTETLDPSNTGEATATDDCSTPNVTYVDGPMTGDCPYTVERTWTAVDPCGNETSCVQTITIVDTVAPVLTGEDEELDLECNVSPSVIAPEVSDNCDMDIELIFNVETIPGDCPNQWTDIYTWTAMDECGNTAVRTLTFNFDDTQAPVFDFEPENFTVECDQAIALPLVTATDNCSTPVVEMTEEEFDLPCGSLIERTWTATDACGNTVSHTQAINVVDTTAPVVVSAPMDVTIECDQPEPTEQPVFSDNCDDELTLTAISGIVQLDCGYEIQRTWSATDDCGNAVSVSQTITVVDTTAPVLEGVPANATVECSDIPAVPVVTASDNCDDMPVVSFSEVNTGGCPYNLVRTWTAVDNCGNQSTMTQTLTVIDNEAPVLVGVPADFNGECGLAPEAGMVTATDNCDEDVTVTMIEEVQGDSCPLTIVRTWTAVDNCGNTVSDSQTITINDETAPVFTAGPADETVECDMVMGPDNDAIEVEDNCDTDVVITYGEVIIPGEPIEVGGVPCGYEIVRTWTATDDCNNMSTYTQTVTVVDTTAPVLMGVPADVTVECTDVPLAPVVTAMDNCFDGQMNVMFNESTNDLDCGYEVVRTWSASDNCGNMVMESQTITVTDTTAPVVVMTPQDVTIECDEALPTANAVFTDDCDESLTLTINDVEVDQDCGYYIIRTWTATDDCGNEASTSQSIFVTDTTAPVLVGVPADTTVECSDIPAAPMVTATDNCDDNVVPTMVEEIISGDCPYTIERTWTAVDECGNTTESTQVLTVVDETAPVVVSAPMDVTIECDQPEPTEEPVFSDNCDDELTLTAISGIVQLDCGYEIQRTWSATDDCGNSVSVSQTITVVDTTAPVVTSTPADLDLECDEEVPFAAATFSDNCDDNLEVDYNEEMIPGDCENTFTLERTWTAMDDCGNMISTTQTINVSDTTAPILVGVPADASVECDNVPAMADVTATDNCDLQVTVTGVETTEDADCGYVITRTWTAVDNCGNMDEATQTITVVDTTAPVAEFVPAMITVECDEEIQDASPIFSDNCDDLLDIVSNEITEDLDCGSTITRSWTATDDCGNATTVSQTINVVDTTAPTVVSSPADVTIECDQPEPTDEPVFTDNCDDELTLTAISGIVQLDCGYEIQRTWTATDDCGNTVSTSQTITVVDTTDPVLIGVPADVTAECDDVPAAATVTADDNCAENLEVFFTEGFEANDCGYELTRTWSTSDECGNTATATQIVTVVDTTAPVVVSSPADVTIECDQPEPTEMAVFSDNCDDELTLEAISSINMLDCGYEINRTWFATDDCGNTTSVSQTITVVDTTAPVIIDGPADVTVQCDEVPGNGMLNVEDNCDELVDVDVTETTEDQECGYIITRTYTAMDDCGNTAVHVQTITVTDTEAPIIVGVPADVTIECGDTVPGPGQVDVTDNCDPMPMITSSEMMEDLDCGYQIIRTYVATDECGNMSEATQTITVSDFTAPVFDTTPEDITVNCDEVTIAPSLTATDNCDDLVEVTLEEVIGDGCPYTITRTWTATDDCGNTATIDQVVTVIDEVAPVFDPFEVFVAVSCDEVDDYIITATDNCGPAQVAIIEELLFSGGCYGTLQRTYEATDECGNSVTATQLVQIIDTTAPELFNVPADVEITCGEDIPAIADDVFATDNCTAEVEIEFEEVQSNEFCPYTITRTWTAIDICGNVTEGVQVIDVTVEVPEQVALVTYPNPFNDKFTVEFSVPRDADVIACVYDMSGREVMPIYKGEADARRLYSFEYANMNWEAGTYILMITVGDEVYHHKMIVTQR